MKSRVHQNITCIQEIEVMFKIFIFSHSKIISPPQLFILSKLS